MKAVLRSNTAHRDEISSYYRDVDILDGDFSPPSLRIFSSAGCYFYGEDFTDIFSDTDFLGWLELPAADAIFGIS